MYIHIVFAQFILVNNIVLSNHVLDMHFLNIYCLVLIELIKIPLYLSLQSLHNSPCDGIRNIIKMFIKHMVIKFGIDKAYI